MRTLLRGRCSTERAWSLPVVNGLRGTAPPFCVAGAVLRTRGRCGTQCTYAAFAWQVQHLERLGVAYGQRSPRDRGPVCVAGAVQHLESRGAQLISHNSSHTTHLPQLHLHYFTYTTHLPHLISHNSSPTTSLTLLHLHNSSPTTHIPQLILHNSFSRPSSFLVSVSLLCMHPFVSKLSGLCKATSVISRCSRLFPSCLVCAKLPPRSADASGSRKRMLHVANILRFKRFRRLIFLHSCAAAGLRCSLLNLEWCLVPGSVCVKRAASVDCRPLLQTGSESEM